MSSVYGDIREVVLRQAPILGDLFRSYFRRDASRFLMQSETPLVTRVVSTLCLVAMLAGVSIIFVFLHPLNKEFSLLQASRGSLQGAALIIVSSLPLYVIVRPGTGIKSLSFFLNLQLVASTIVCAVSFVLIIIGLLLSPNFASDVNEIAKGGGKSTVLHRAFCNDLEFRRDTLRLQLELNRLAGDYDHPSMRAGLLGLLQSGDDQFNEMMPFLLRQVDRESRLPQAERERIQRLRLAISGRVVRLTDYSPVISEYPYFFYPYFASFIMVPITAFITYLMIWKIFVRSGRSRQRKGVMRVRVIAGICVSIVFSLWFFNAVMNQTLYVRWSLENEVERLHADAQRYAWCRLDPKGLW